MRILVTGAGLVGAHAAAALSSDHEVVLADIAPDDRYVRSVAQDRVRLERCDVTDREGLRRLMANVNAVIHTAGLIGPLAQSQPHQAFSVNVVGTLQVVEAARLAGVDRLIYASTHGVYDFTRGPDEPMPEQSPTAAHSVYAASKLAAEQVLRAYADAYGMAIVALRFCNLFGRGRYVAGSRGGEAFNELITSVARGEPGPIGSPLAGRSEWLYAKDAGRAVAAAVAAAVPTGFTIVNIGSGDLTGPDDLLRSISRVVPDARFVTAGAPGRERRQPFDLSRARRVLRWAPTFTLEAAIADYIAEIRALAA